MSQTPRLILGTMSFGGQTNAEDTATMLFDFVENSNWKDVTTEPAMIDTAIMYQNGETEKLLGRILGKHEEKRQKFAIATKANPFGKGTDLSPEGCRSQLEESLQSLGQDSVDVFYLHAPDAHHHIEPTLEEVQKMFREGKFHRFALSNFCAWETVYIHSFMTQRGYIAPTIYQGMYNSITRMVETALFPALRKLGMSFYAYNPLAGGMLSGKYQLFLEKDGHHDNDDAKAAVAVEAGGKGSRFAGKTKWAKIYRDRFQQKQQFEAVAIVQTALEQAEGDETKRMTLAEASLRWMRHHSKLSEKDAIIVGASKISHYEANMAALKAGPLPDSIVQAFDKANQHCEGVCPNYERGYSGSALEAI